jgi:predicted TIM-barrel fold metal-dependent hydrolase
VLASRRVWVTCEYEDHLDYLLPHVGEDSLVIGTDYGHTDPFSNVRALQTFIDRSDVSDRAKKKIVDTNARAFYGIADDQLPAHVRQAAAGAAAS